MRADPACLCLPGLGAHLAISSIGRIRSGVEASRCVDGAGGSGTVTGLFYGDARQFVAQCIGTATCAIFVFGMFFVFFEIVEATMGNRVSVEVELAGLDIPEMGALGYPDFVLKSPSVAPSTR